MRVTISVTKQDISHGCPRTGFCCPIFLAASRKLQCTYAGKVQCTYAELTGLQIAYDKFYEMPESAIQFIRDFESGRPVKPFRFTVDVPARYLKRRKAK